MFSTHFYLSIRSNSRGRWNSRNQWNQIHGPKSRRHGKLVGKCITVNIAIVVKLCRNIASVNQIINIGNPLTVDWKYTELSGFFFAYLHFLINIISRIVPWQKMTINKFQKTPYIILHFIIGQNNWTRDTETRTKAGRALPKTGK